MAKKDEEVKDIPDVVEATLDLMPLPSIVKHFLVALFEAAPKLFMLFQNAGGRDGFFVALDVALETARKKDLADIKRKHGR